MSSRRDDRRDNHRPDRHSHFDHIEEETNAAAEERRFVENTFWEEARREDARRREEARYPHASIASRETERFASGRQNPPVSSTRNTAPIRPRPHQATGAPHASAREGFIRSSYPTATFNPVSRQPSTPRRAAEPQEGTDACGPRIHDTRSSTGPRSVATHFRDSAADDSLMESAIESLPPTHFHAQTMFPPTFAPSAFTHPRSFLIPTENFASGHFTGAIAPGTRQPRSESRASGGRDGALRSDIAHGDAFQESTHTPRCNRSRVFHSSGAGNAAASRGPQGITRAASTTLARVPEAGNGVLRGGTQGMIQMQLPGMATPSTFQVRKTVPVQNGFRTTFTVDTPAPILTAQDRQVQENFQALRASPGFNQAAFEDFLRERSLSRGFGPVNHSSVELEAHGLRGEDGVHRVNMGTKNLRVGDEEEGWVKLEDSDDEWRTL